jgi:hypothetical protein
MIKSSKIGGFWEFTRVCVPPISQAKPKWHFLEADEIEYSRDYISKNSRMFYLQRLQAQMMQQQKAAEEQMQRDELVRQQKEMEAASAPPRPLSPSWFMAIAKQSVLASVWKFVESLMGAMVQFLVNALSQVGLYNRFVRLATGNATTPAAAENAEKQLS